MFCLVPFLLLLAIPSQHMACLVSSSQSPTPANYCVKRNGRSITLELVPLSAETEQNKFHLRNVGTEWNDLFEAFVPVILKFLELKRNKFPDTVNAVMWLRSNRDQFKKPIHEPVALVVRNMSPLWFSCSFCNPKN